jgi:hypothetical protein
MNASNIVALALVAGGMTVARAEPPTAYETSIHKLMFAEQVMREAEQQSLPWRLDAGACRRLINSVPSDSLASAYVTSREQWCIDRGTP